MPDRQSPQDIPLSIRAAVLTLHHFQDKSWLEISALLPVGPDTAEEIWNRAKERAVDPTDIKALVKALEG